VYLYEGGRSTDNLNTSTLVGATVGQRVCAPFLIFVNETCTGHQQPPILRSQSCHLTLPCPKNKAPMDNVSPGIPSFMAFFLRNTSHPLTRAPPDGGTLTCRTRRTETGDADFTTPRQPTNRVCKSNKKFHNSIISPHCIIHT